RPRLREGDPSLHRPGLAVDPPLPLPRQRRPLDADKDCLGLLAHRRLPVRLHRRLTRVSGAARSRAALQALRLSERHARAPERLERPRPGHSVAADLRRRRAFWNPPPEGRADDLLAALEAVFLAPAD